MMELVEAAFLPINVGFTVLLLLIVLYWVTVILGVLDVELFDIDLADALDADVDADADLHVDGGALKAILHFFYVGEVPVMLLLSLVIMSMWAMAMLGNYYLNPAGAMLPGMVIGAGSFVVSLFVCRCIALPIKTLYAAFNKDYNAPKQVIGRICTVTTSSVSQALGQAEIRTKGAPILLNVISDSDHVFKKGDEALIVSQDKEKGIYKIAKVNLEKAL